MTQLRPAAAAALPVPRRPEIRPTTARLIVAVCWLAVPVTALLSLDRAGVPALPALGYFAAWAIGCTVPGVLWWRFLAGPSTLVRELGFGSVLGIVIQLLTWAVATAVQLTWMLPLSPAVTITLFLAVPRLRRYWWPRRTGAETTPLRWHLSMAALVALTIFLKVAAFRPRPVPPELIPRDTWYNVAISEELGRTLRPQDPFAAGERLRYHWFADAHITATAQAGSAPIVDVMLNLWPVAMVFTVLVVVAAAAEQMMTGTTRAQPGRASVDRLSGAERWWVGPLSGFFVLVAPAVWVMYLPGLSRVSSGFVVSSPSGTLALALVLALVGPMAVILRGRSRWGTWLVLLLFLGISVGTKPSILPVVIFGCAVVALLQILRGRIPITMLAIVAIAVSLTVLTFPILAGSVGGSHLQLFSLVTLDPSYVRLYDNPVLAGAGGWLVPALTDGVPYAVPIVAMVVVLRILTEVPRLLCWAGAVVPPLRTDPLVVWGAAVTLGGWGAMWVTSHTGYSQHYFWTVTVALATVLTVTNAVRLLPADQRGRRLALPVAAAAVPGFLAALVFSFRAPLDFDLPLAQVALGRIGPYVLLLVLGVAIAVAAQLMNSRSPRWSLPVLTAVTAFALAAAVPQALVDETPSEPVRPSTSYGSTAQQSAAAWLQAHSHPSAVVATNAFCWPMRRNAGPCRSGFTWLPGLIGRRMVLGDWLYSPATQAAYRWEGSMNDEPPPWPERFALSLAAAERPTPEVLGRLRRDYGARWLFLDTRATAVSPKLNRLARLEYARDHIKIYRLRDNYAL